MTYVEFFDKTAVENIGTCLTRTPTRVIYVGDNARVMKAHVARYKQLLESRGQTVEFLVKTVTKSNLESAVHLLTEIVETYENCVFDVTGGGEILLLALGIVYTQYPEKNIQIHRFNLHNNVLADCDKDGKTVFCDMPSLSVEENVRIYGGEIVYGDVGEQKTYRWDITPEFAEDVALIWGICKDDVRFWNVQAGIFEAMEQVGTVSEDGLTTTAMRTVLENHLKQCGAKYKRATDILNALLNCGLLTAFDDGDEETITVSYKNAQVKRCLTKAGQALEMKIYLAARDVTDGEGNPVYGDVLNGVVVDWDGELHEDAEEKTYDTKNEIDVWLMHGVVPVFISCKNGIVTSDELYKLNTVADRFGGAYSKKVLITTSLSSLGELGAYVRERAEDMKIRVIDGVQNIDDAELARKIKSLWSN